ncbi:MAG: hypothetical protein AAF203_09855 [Pseudomonadota bacterium]
MSNDNLILFPKKSTPRISMSQSEAKWMLSGSLLVVLTVALGVNSALFSSSSQARGTAGIAAAQGERSIASINPIFRVSWEKKAFEVLEKTKERELANIGQPPTAFDHFAFGNLKGLYSIRKVDGKISEIRFAENPDESARVLIEREKFLNDHLAFFSEGATQAKKVHVQDNAEMLIEKFDLQNGQGQSLGTIQVLLDKDQKLISMTVQ